MFRRSLAVSLQMYMYNLLSLYSVHSNNDLHERLFSLGDRLTDERVQSAQQAMSNAETPKDQLHGFISKIEDWHRMMNFMEVRCFVFPVRRDQNCLENTTLF